MEKKELRAWALDRLSSKPAEFRLDETARIVVRLLNEPSFANAAIIGITMAREPEITTATIIEACWERGITVALPRCEKDRSMTFYKVTSFSDLEDTFNGLREPKRSCSVVSPSTIDSLLVPGLLFTEKGDRLGFGGGYYDRFLPNASCTFVSICFEEQLVPSLPAEKHDIPVHKLILPDRVISCV